MAIPYSFGMMPETERVAEHLKKVGKRLVEIEGFVLALAETEAQLYKLVAQRVETFTPEEKAILQTSAQRSIETVRSLQGLHREMEKDVEDFSEF